MQRFHLGEVQRIDALTYHRPWSLAMWRQELSLADSRRYLVATVGSRHVGHAGMMQVVDEAHVTTVAVDPDWQRQGIAAKLMLSLHNLAIDRGVTAMTLEVRVSNVAAIGLYRRFGYAPAGVRKNYYSDEGEDGLVMWVHDIADSDHRERLAHLAADVQIKESVHQ